MRRKLVKRLRLFSRKKIIIEIGLVLLLLVASSFVVGAWLGSELVPSFLSSKNKVKDAEQNTSSISQSTKKAKTALAELFNRSTDIESSNNQTTQIFNPDCNESRSLQEGKNCSYVVITDKGHGTGFAISSEFLVTNKHVIDQAESIGSVVDGQDIGLSLWNYAEDADIALLKSEESLNVCQWADSDQIMLAETLFAIGWPNSASGESSITRGIYSRLIQTDEGPVFIQTDTAINPGNSGGPLIGSCGVVGINTSKISWSQDNVPAEGFSFAITSNYAQQTVEELIQTGFDHQLPIGKIDETKYSFITEKQTPSVTNEYYVSQESKDSWLKARTTTQELADFWQSSSGDYNQSKLEELKDLIARMQAVIQIVVPKIEQGQAINKDEEQLLRQWIEMYEKAVRLEGEIFNRDFSKGYVHLECANHSCVLVNGRDKDQCSDVQDCAPKYYYACDNLTCVVKEGEGENECSSHDDCYYYACQDDRCVKVSGNEEDQCYHDLHCK